MFQFTGFPPHGYGFTVRYMRYAHVGFPIQTPADNNGYVLLPAAFRSLSRLSSALSAKASALCPSLLNLISFYRMHSVACPGTVFVLLFLLITRTSCISAFTSGYLGCLIRIFKLFFIKFLYSVFKEHLMETRVLGLPYKGCHAAI